VKRLQRSGRQALVVKQRELKAVAGRHALLGHDSVLQRGFALVRDAEGRLVRSAKTVKPGGQVSIQYADGRQDAVIDGGGVSKPRARPRKETPPEKQGRLF
jgi:exodeoxyribonuclease VII large subunit